MRPFCHFDLILARSENQQEQKSEKQKGKVQNERKKAQKKALKSEPKKTKNRRSQAVGGLAEIAIIPELFRIFVYSAVRMI